MKFIVPLLLALCFVFVPALVSGHSRWKCPKARDWNDADGQHIVFDNTGNKPGPCGPFSGKFGMGGVVNLTANTWQTFVAEESVAHTGAPFRISILDENEVERLVLLDHIPHNDDSKPTPYIESTYVPYRINVFIPDVQCDKCTLRVLMIMTDKTVACGTPVCTYRFDDAECSGHTDSSPACAGASSTSPCKYADSCFSNYHSCFDATINGTVPLKDAKFPQPAQWPYGNLTNLQYGDEAGTWANGLLQNVPAIFNTPQGVDYCAN